MKNELFDLAKRLFPICRSLTGNGVRKTLEIIKEKLPSLQIHEVPTGTKCFDWTVPKEWNINDGYIIDPEGKKIVDFKENNLHVVGYSVPVDQEMELDQLQSHLYSLPEQPEAIPYITSYYKERWGFCLAHNVRKRLKKGVYRVKIDSSLKEGSLTYGECFLKGQSEKEIFLSTYICHPSMANNELSGPCVTTFLAKMLQAKPTLRHSVRLVFVPETIGSICYLSKHLERLKKNVVAGFVVTCVGDTRTYSFLPSREGNSLADEAAQHVLKHIAPSYIHYSFLDRGSDERQYCSPGIDLPVTSIMRSKYGTYPEYHTSLDNLSFISPEGLEGSFNAYKLTIEAIEMNCTPKTKTLCEPMLSKRGLYPSLSTPTSGQEVKNMMNLLAYADGKKSLLQIANLINVPIWELSPILNTLINHEVL